jgi:hypothetical protein
MFGPITYNTHLQTVSLDQPIREVKDGKQNSPLAFVDNPNELGRIQYWDA